MQSSVMKIMSENNFCVLCTCNNDIPDASLMLYICDNLCTKMHMLTLKETTKYANIINNQNVSLLIDTRDTIQDKTSQIRALTIHGEASIVTEDDAAKELIDQMMKKHDTLSNLALNKNVCVIEVSIKSILFLENVDKGRKISLPGN